MREGSSLRVQCFYQRQIMSQFFNPIAALQILKNLEMAPKNRAPESVSCQNVPEGHDGYIIFLLDNGLIACDEEAQAHGITYKGRILLRQAEMLVLAEDASVRNDPNEKGKNHV